VPEIARGALDIISRERVQRAGVAERVGHGARGIGKPIQAQCDAVT
jgi:hypothetical protein